MLRLIENTPSWEVHALLRFCGISYKVDYSPQPTALGRVLPVLVDDEGAYDGHDLFQCVQRHCQRRNELCREERVIDELVSSTLRQRFDELWQSLLHISGSDKDQAVGAAPFGVNIYLGYLFDLQNAFSGNR